MALTVVTSFRTMLTKYWTTAWKASVFVCFAPIGTLYCYINCVQTLSEYIRGYVVVFPQFLPSGFMALKLTIVDWTYVLPLHWLFKLKLVLSILRLVNVFVWTKLSVWLSSAERGLSIFAQFQCKRKYSFSLWNVSIMRVFKLAYLCHRKRKLFSTEIIT